MKHTVPRHTVGTPEALFVPEKDSRKMYISQPSWLLPWLLPRVAGHYSTTSYITALQLQNCITAHAHSALTSAVDYACDHEVVLVVLVV